MAYPAYFAEFIYYEMSKEWLDPKHTYYRYRIKSSPLVNECYKSTNAITKLLYALQLWALGMP